MDYGCATRLDKWNLKIQNNLLILKKKDYFNLLSVINKTFKA